MKFTSIFGKSPFKPLREHMEKSVEAIVPLKPFFDALQKGDYERMEVLRQEVFVAEEAADHIKNEIRNHLPKSVFMPIDRRDLLEVLDMQDSIADTAQDIVSLLELRRMKLPEEMEEPLQEYIKFVKDACFLARDISRETEQLIESDFSSYSIDKILGMIEDLSKAEDKTDEIGIDLSRKLFSIEDQMKPVDVVFWYELFEWIGDLADFAEKMGNRYRLIIAKA